METKKLKKGKFSAVTIPMLLLFIVIIALTLLPFISIFLASFRPGNEIMRQGLVPCSAFGNNCCLLLTFEIQKHIIVCVVMSGPPGGRSADI